MRSVNLRLGLSVRQWSMERHLCFSSGESQSVGEDNMDDWCLFCMWDCWSLVMSGYESSSALLPGSWNVQEWGNLREGSLVLTGIVKAVEEPEDVSVAWICYSISAEGGGECWDQKGNDSCEEGLIWMLMSGHYQRESIANLAQKLRRHWFSASSRKVDQVNVTLEMYQQSSLSMAEGKVRSRRRICFAYLWVWQILIWIACAVDCYYSPRPFTLVLMNSTFFYCL